jgi:GNAT superfamily N-acetyltransferase
MSKPDPPGANKADVDATAGLVSVAPLRTRPALCAVFAAAFEAEWPDWYGMGGRGHAADDLRAFANAQGGLPVGVVALGSRGEPVGVAALKRDSIPSHAHLTPWAAAGYVVAPWRRRGIGAAMLSALANEAARLGFASVYCATATAASLLRREGWSAIDTVFHDGQALQVFVRPSSGERAAGKAP